MVIMRKYLHCTLNLVHMYINIVPCAHIYILSLYLSHNMTPSTLYIMLLVLCKKYTQYLIHSAHSTLWIVHIVTCTQNTQYIMYKYLVNSSLSPFHIVHLVPCKQYTQCDLVPSTNSTHSTLSTLYILRPVPCIQYTQYLDHSPPSIQIDR